MQSAIGLIETKGLIGLVEATDAMAKAANVEIISWCAPYLFSTNNNHAICSAWRITGKNSFEMGWRYEYSFILGFRPQLDFTPLSIR